MRIFREELKKLVTTPMIWIFVALSLALNAFWIFGFTAYSNMPSYVDYLSHTFAQTGVHMGLDFDERLATTPDHLYKEALVSQTKGAVPSFTVSDASEAATMINELTRYDESLSPLIASKYHWMEPAIERLVQIDASMDVYAVVLSTDLHRNLFGTLLGSIFVESILLTVLIVLYALGYETVQRTHLTVYASKAGRVVHRAKIAAATLFSMGLYAGLTLASLGLYFSQWDYSGLWHSNVASQFNVLTYFLVSFPFWTWTPFTLLGYMVATLILIGIILIVFSLFGSVFGQLISNTYLSFIAFFAVAFGSFALTYVLFDLGQGVLGLLTNLLPVQRVLLSTQWFTHMGPNSFLPWHETIATFFNLFLFALLSHFAAEYFARKDIL